MTEDGEMKKNPVEDRAEPTWINVEGDKNLWTFGVEWPEGHWLRGKTHRTLWGRVLKVKESRYFSHIPGYGRGLHDTLEEAKNEVETMIRERER